MVFVEGLLLAGELYNRLKAAQNCSNVVPRLHAFRDWNAWTPTNVQHPGYDPENFQRLTE